MCGKLYADSYADLYVKSYVCTAPKYIFARPEPEFLVVLKVDASSNPVLFTDFSPVKLVASSVLVPFSLSLSPMSLIGQTQRCFIILETSACQMPNQNPNLT
jgi:hypothetical protein